MKLDFSFEDNTTNFKPQLNESQQQIKTQFGELQVIGSVVVDPTLTIEGAAADAKAVGDALRATYMKLNSNTSLGFYCIEDVTIVTNGVSKTYPANSNVEVSFADGDVFEIIPTSDNSILSLTAFPGALGTFYPWLEGVAQFSNILFDMNDVAMYSKWSQGNQGSYHVQKAQYLNCIFWSDNPYVSDVSKRTNYTLTHTSQLPLCYSNIPDNTFKAFYLAFGVNSDPNWGNQVYKDSFAKANWATQVFSYYGARTIGIFGHDDPDFNIVLPKDCRGLMCEATAVENAGTFDAINVTNFGAKQGSWRDAFRMCYALRNLYIKNLKVNLNVSWSPLEYDSIYFILSTAANTKKITISVSPYTYNLLSPSDFELATSKNIVIELLTANYVEDKRLSGIPTDAHINDLINTALDNIPSGGSVELDTTLTESGKAADAKAVGDALGKILPTMVVNITDHENGDGDYTYTADKTFDEIIDCINNGGNVEVRYFGTVYKLCYYNENFCWFSYNSSDTELVYCESVEIHSDGDRGTVVINYHEYDPQCIPQPYNEPSAGQIIAVSEVDENGRIIATEAVDMPSGGGGGGSSSSEWTKLGDITVSGTYEFNILAIDGGVVTLDTNAEGYSFMNGKRIAIAHAIDITATNNVSRYMIRLLPKDYSAGTFDVYNLDGVIQSSVSFNTTQYKLSVQNIWSVVMTGIPQYDRYKMRAFFPVIQSHGLRVIFSCNVSSLGFGASTIAGYGASIFEKELFTFPYNPNYMVEKATITYGNLYPARTDTMYKAVTIVKAGENQTRPKNDTIEFMSYHCPFVNGTRFEVWGANDV